MKKLYSNIDNINIKGRPELLSVAITKIDVVLQALASSTQKVKQAILQYGGSNFGNQYERACVAISNLSRELAVISADMNELQHQVVRYENKCHIYEGEPPSAVSPAGYQVQEIQAEVNVSEFQFHLNEMHLVKKSIDLYISSSAESMGIMRMYRDEIGTFWQDTQFRDFSQIIDEVGAVVYAGCRELEMYSTFLSGKIRELSN